jgi:hypothetical protein
MLIIYFSKATHANICCHFLVLNSLILLICLSVNINIEILYQFHGCLSNLGVWRYLIPQLPVDFNGSAFSCQVSVGMIVIIHSLFGVSLAIISDLYWIMHVFRLQKAQVFLLFWMLGEWMHQCPQNCWMLLTSSARMKVNLHVWLACQLKALNRLVRLSLSVIKWWVWRPLSLSALFASGMRWKFSRRNV